MKTVLDLYVATRERFPDLAARADELHIQRWDAVSSELAYVWFESLAAAINADMSADVPFREREALFRHLVDAFESSSEEVRNCVDVSFAENLFWEVQSSKAEHYWSSLPQRLKDLYVAFHERTPL